MTIINEFYKELGKLFPISKLTILKVTETKLDVCGDLNTMDFYQFMFNEHWIMGNLEKYLPVKCWRYFRLHPEYAHAKNYLRISSTDIGVKKYAPCIDLRQFSIEQLIKSLNMGLKLYQENLFTTAIYLFFSALIKRYEDMLKNQEKGTDKTQDSDNLKKDMNFWVNTSQNMNGIRGLKASPEKPKYTCIITSEPDGPGLSYISDHPWEGNLEETIQFNTIEELFAHDVEGLFYQLFDNESGRRLGYGMIDPDYPATDIQDFEKESEHQGHLIIISGFSRAGKNAIADGLKELSDNYIYSISATTRQPRPDERNEVDYHFITPECFEKIKESGGFLETAEYCGNSYGTLALPVTKALKEGRDMVLVLETEGAMKVKDLFPTALTFFVAAPAADLKSRMKETGISEDDMKKRLAEIRKEITMIPKYDYLIMNENGKLDKNIELVHNIIKGQKSKTSEKLDIIESLRKEFC